MTRALPLLRYKDLAMFSRNPESAVSTADFLGDVHALAGRLPKHGHVINLFQSRYHFMVGFAAAMLRNQVTLLPPNQTIGVMQELVGEFPDSYYLCEDEQQGLTIPNMLWRGTEQRARVELPLSTANSWLQLRLPLVPRANPRRIRNSGATSTAAPNRRSNSSALSHGNMVR